jgi:membrane associated rhomboid family serine protease
MSFFRLRLSLYFGLRPDLVVSELAFFQFFTYMFLHGGFFHLLINMFILWMFGSDLEREWGAKAFLFYYLLTGVGAGLLNFLAMLNSSIPTIGASGAIYGILAAFGMLFPNRMIYIYFLFPVKAKYFVLFLGFMAFYSAFTLSNSSIAHFAHLGGMVIGYLYIKFDFQLFRFRNFFKSRTPNMTVHWKEDNSEDIKSEVDRILDKIQQSGFESLTDKEREKLKNASDYFKKH